MLILGGIEKDGVYKGMVEPQKSDKLLMAIIADLTDSKTVSALRKELDDLKTTDRELAAKLKANLLEKYANDKTIRAISGV